MARILIIGVGNPLRCDDGLAWRVVRELSVRDLPDDVEVITQHQLTPDLAQPASRADTVLFLDAAQDAQAGEFKCGPVTAVNSVGVFSHEFSPGSILGLARELYGKSPRGFLLSLGGECFEHGETLSCAVEQELPRVVSFLNDLIMQAIPNPGMGLVHG